MFVRIESSPSTGNGVDIDFQKKKLGVLTISICVVEIDTLMKQNCKTFHTQLVLTAAVTTLSVTYLPHALSFWQHLEQGQLFFTFIDRMHIGIFSSRMFQQRNYAYLELEENIPDHLHSVHIICFRWY